MILLLEVNAQESESTVSHTTSRYPYKSVGFKSIVHPSDTLPYFDDIKKGYCIVNIIIDTLENVVVDIEIKEIKLVSKSNNTFLINYNKDSTITASLIETKYIIYCRKVAKSVKWQRVDEVFENNTYFPIVDSLYFHTRFAFKIKSGE